MKPGRAAEATSGSVSDFRLRVEAELRIRLAQLAEQSIGHLGLVSSVPQDRLRDAVGGLGVYGQGADLVIARGASVEPHGGGILALLLAHWRPGNRPARFEDRFLFGLNRRSVTLGDLYRALRQQVYADSPSIASNAGPMASVQIPSLPRVHLPDPAGSRTNEADAYHALLLLFEYEPNPLREWENRMGQWLSIAKLYDRVLAFYQAAPPKEREPEDHSELHLVEVLLAGSRRLDRDPEPIRQRFLAVELAQRSFELGHEELMLAHTVESVGLLMDDARLDWTQSERKRIAAWVAGVSNSPFARLDSVDPRQLAHLVRGLRLLDRGER